MVCHSRASTEKPGAGTYFVCFVIGLFLGFVFMQMPKWNGEITRDEAIPIVGTYQECQVSYKSGRIHSISLILSDTEKRFVHQTCCSKALAESLCGIHQDTEVSLLVHPNSRYILEIEVDGVVLLDFDHSQEALTSNASGFFLLGLGMAAIAVYCFVRYVIEEVKFYRR